MEWFYINLILGSLNILVYLLDHNESKLNLIMGVVGLTSALFCYNG